MALIDKGYAHLHHLAFDVVDIGQMRAALDHLGRHGRWLGWGPTRHGVGGNIASYVRIVEEECFVELYCDMEQLERRPRAAPLARRPLLVQHLGPAAAALLLPLRRRRGRVRAREPGDAGMTLPGLHDPAHARRAGRASSRRRRGTTSATSSSSTTGPTPTPCARCCPPAWTRTRTPAAAPRCSPTGSRARDGGRRAARPVRSHYREFFIVANALLDGEEVTTCPFIWVDQDFALARGWIQGFPKKLGSIWMTRTFGLDVAGRPRAAARRPPRRRRARRAGARSPT